MVKPSPQEGAGSVVPALPYLAVQHFIYSWLFPSLCPPDGKQPQKHTEQANRGSSQPTASAVQFHYARKAGLKDFAPLWPAITIPFLLPRQIHYGAPRPGYFQRRLLWDNHSARFRQLKGRSGETWSKLRCFHRVPCSTDHKRHCVAPSSFPFIQSVIRKNPKEQQWKSTLQVSNGNFFLPPMAQSIAH